MKSTWELEKIEREQKKRLKEATEDQRKADLAALRVRQRETELRRHGLGELKNLLSESRKTLENLVRELRESGVSTDKTKDVKSFLADLSASVEKQYGISRGRGAGNWTRKPPFLGRDPREPRSPLGRAPQADLSWRKARKCSMGLPGRECAS